MRKKYNSDEKWAVDKFISHLSDTEPQWYRDKNYCDKPDLVLDDKKGKRIACELTMVGLEEWYRWHNDKKLQKKHDKLEEISVPCEPNIWVSKSIDKKEDKIGKYCKNANASESWLIIHSPCEKQKDLFNLDDKHYFIPLLHLGADIKHHFKRVYIVSATSKKEVIQIYPINKNLKNTAPLLNPQNIQYLTIKQMMKVVHRGKNEIKVSKEYTPHYGNTLPLLGNYE